jgi:hypothetical protein
MANRDNLTGVTDHSVTGDWGLVVRRAARRERAARIALPGLARPYASSSERSYSGVSGSCTAGSSTRR